MISKRVCVVCLMVGLALWFSVALGTGKNARRFSLEWTRSTPFPEPRAGYASGVIGDKVVIAGGTYWEGSKGNWTRKAFSASTHAFDPVTQTWEKLPDAPTPFGYASSATVGNRLFVLGGYTGSEVIRKVYVLEKRGNSYQWSAFGQMPEPRLFAGAVGIQSRIYLLGGTSQFEPLDASGSCCTTSSATNTLMMLDTAKPESGWQQLPPYPGHKRWLFASEADSNALWMFGGTFQNRQQDPVTMFDDVVRYVFSKGAWEIMPDLPQATRQAVPLTAFPFEDRMILVSAAKRVWELSLRSFEYNDLAPLPESAYIDKFLRVNNTVIGAGGENSIEGPRRRSEWTFVGHGKWN